MQEYYVYVKTNSVDSIINASNIAFMSGKGKCGCGFTNSDVTKFCIFGKFCDKVRVYSALKNNGFEIC